MYGSSSKTLGLQGIEGSFGVRSVQKPLITDRAMAARIARRLFEIYDRDHNGVIDEHEVPELISDAYKTINKAVKSDKDDAKTMIEVIDADRDGRATLTDMERLVGRYLCGN